MCPTELRFKDRSWELKEKSLTELFMLKDELSLYRRNGFSYTEINEELKERGFYGEY